MLTVCFVFVMCLWLFVAGFGRLCGWFNMLFG